MGSNAGFIGLKGPLGLVLIGFAGLMLIGLIYVGARLMSAKEQADRAKRAELRKQLEAKKDQS